MSTYVKVDRGVGARAGQLLRHVDDPKRWQVRVFLFRDERGRKRYHTEVVHGGRRAAEARLLELLQSKSSGGLKPRTQVTLRDLVEEWARHKAREVSIRTLDGYRAALERYVLPTLGHRKIGELHLREIDRLYGLMLAGELPKVHESDEASPGKLSARTVRLTHAALTQALAQAVSWGLIATNPAAGATIPTSKPKEKAVLTEAECAAFLDACASSFYGVFYRTLLFTGLRPGEACALLWSDVDFARGTISVQRAVTRGENGTPTIAEPKTVKSRRTVRMLRDVREALMSHLEWQRSCNLDAAGYVFTNEAGDPLRPWTFSTRDLERTLKRAGVWKRVTLYSLRHTFATLHVAAGTPIKLVADVLGHATIQQTANTYMHTDHSVAAEWMDRFEQHLERGRRAVVAAPN